VHHTKDYFKSVKENSIILETISKDYTDRLHINFNNETTEGFDLQHDACKLMSGTAGLSELWSFTGDKMLSIDVCPNCEVIQLGFSDSENGFYNIGIHEITTDSETTLKDTKTNTFHDLKKNRYEFVYDTLDSRQRFKLHLNAVGIEESINTNNEIKVYAAGKTIYMNNFEVEVPVQIIVSDITGRVVLGKDLETTNSIAEINTNLKQGIYLVSLISGNTIETEKIFIK
jgi:hypothetical protein